MSELSTSLEPAETFEVSTQLDEGRPAEGSPAKEAPEEKPKPESRLDAIKRAADDVQKANPEEKPAEKAPEPKEGEEAAKPDAEKPADEPKPVEAEKKAEQPTDQRPRRQPIEPPEKFLPRAKELWVNTPHEVRADMQRVISEAEAETAQARESVREFEAVRPYAEMAKQSGTTIDQALGRYVKMEQSLRQNPTAGFAELLSNMQIGPQQAIGHILAAYGIAPERVAQHMAEAPNEYTALAQPQRQQAPQQQADPRVAQLEQQLAQLQQGMAHRDVESTIIAPFAAENPRYYELEATIAHFLRSDIVPKSLSPHDRLAAAYDMAVRISPSVKQPASSAQTESLGEKEESRAGDFGGNKSVRGAPASGVDTSNPRRGKMSRGEALKAAFDAAGLAH